jgi:hypothetical protein
MVKTSTVAMADRETLGMAELMKGVTLSQNGKSTNIPGRRQQLFLYQYRAEDRSQKGLYLG